MPLDNVFSKGIIFLWSNTDTKYIEQNSKESIIKTPTILLYPKSVDIIVLTKF